MTVLIEKGHYFILRSYFVKIFAGLMKAQLSTLVKLVKLKKKTVCT